MLSKILLLVDHQDDLLCNSACSKEGGLSWILRIYMMEGES